MTHKQVVNQVVENDMCIGCGICAGVCPSKILEMGWMDNGDLGVEIDGDCPPKCDLCLQVCPFVTDNKNEDELAALRFEDSCKEYDQEVGYYHDLFVGHAENSDQRKKGASGGIITQLLKHMLETEEVDTVYCVGLTNEDGRLFEFVEVNDPELLEKCASSKYYPVEASKIIAELQKKGSNKRAVITGLPCTLKGISLAMNRLPRLRKQIRYTIGLVCGLLPNKFYTEYLSALSTGKDHSIQSVNYRSKEGTILASNFNFIAKDSTGSWGKPLSFFEVVGIPYSNSIFQHNACNFCDDVFAETADLTVMDAWLPQYIFDIGGTSLIVSRSEGMSNLLKGCESENKLKLQTIDLNLVKRSQQGVVLKKRNRLADRLSWARKKGMSFPKKRVEPSEKVSWFKNIEISAKFNIQKNSKKLWGQGIPAEEFIRHPSIRWPLFVLRIGNVRDRVSNFVNNPARLVHFIKRRIKSKRAF